MIAHSRQEHDEQECAVKGDEVKTHILKYHVVKKQTH